MIHDHQLETFRGIVANAFKAGLPHFPHYTLHGIEHLNELDRLCLLFQDTIPNLNKQPEKVQILRLAIIMHDYAMVDVPDPERETELRAEMKDPNMSFADLVRKTHQDEIILSLEKKGQTLFNSFADAENDEILDAVEVARYHRFHPLEKAPDHLKGLCALMRLIDELDIGGSRAPRSVYSSLRGRMDMESRYHWLKHICCSRIEKDRTFFHESSNGKHTLKLLVAIQATESSWVRIQSKVLRKLKECLDKESVRQIVKETLAVDISIEGACEKGSVCGVASILHPEIAEDLDALVKCWDLSDTDNPDESSDSDRSMGSLPDCVETEANIEPVPLSDPIRSITVSDRELTIWAIPPEELFRHLSKGGRLSVTGNTYVPHKEIHAGGRRGAPSRIYIGPADCGKTRAAAEWIHKLTRSRPASWVVLRTDLGGIPENTDDNIILDRSFYRDGELPQKAVLFLDDLPGNLPPTGSDKDASAAIRRLLVWYNNQPYFQEHRFAGTIRCEDLHSRPGWPEALPEINSDLKLLRLGDLIQDDYRRIWRGMEKGKIFVSQSQGAKSFNLALSDAFIDKVSKESTNPEGIAQFVFDKVRDDCKRLTEKEADEFKSSAVQTWLTETWPVVLKTYGVAARVFHTIARFLEPALRPDSGFRRNLIPAWEFHAVFGQGLCDRNDGNGDEYVKIINQMGSDGHAVGKQGKLIRPRWDYLLQTPVLEGVEIDLPDVNWFASRAKQLPPLLRTLLALHLTLGDRETLKIPDPDDHWLMGVAEGKDYLAELAKEDDARVQLRNEVIVCYRKALEINPRNDKAWNNLGVRLGAQSKIEEDPAVSADLSAEVIACYRKAVEINPRNDNAWNNLGVRLGAQSKIEEDPAVSADLSAEAIACYRKAVEINPRHDKAWTNLGVRLGAQSKIEEDPAVSADLSAEVIACYRKAVEINPRYDNAWNNLGVSLGAQSEIEEDPAVSTDLSAEEIACYRKAVEINPRNDQAWNNLGVSLGAQSEIEEDPAVSTDLSVEEVACYRKAVEINPRNDQAWTNLGVSLGAQSEIEEDPAVSTDLSAEAIACYRKAVEINPRYDQAWNNLGVCLGAQSKIEKDPAVSADLSAEAIACYRKAVEINPRYDQAWNNLGVRLGAQSKIEEDPAVSTDLSVEEVACYRKAVEINPRYDQAWTNLAVGLIGMWKSNKQFELLEEAMKAAQTQKRLIDHAYNLACVLALMEKSDEAFDELEGCLESGDITWNHVHGDDDWELLRGHPRYFELQSRFG